MLSNIYAPNSPGRSFFSDLSTWLLRHPLAPHIVGGNFNITLHPIEDRSAPKRSLKLPKTTDPTLLASTIDSLHFKDIWRPLHPADRDFTFYSNPHNVLTRINYLFCTDNLVPKISGAEIHDIAISDHAPISVSIDDPDLYLNPSLWRFPSYLHNNADFQSFMEKAWTEYSTANSPHTDHPNLFWEARRPEHFLCCFFQKADLS